MQVSWRRAAFTLVELLVVLTIIAVTAAMVVPRLQGSLRAMRVREAALTLAESIRFAQMLAVDRQRTVRIRIDRGHRRYFLERVERPYSDVFVRVEEVSDRVGILPENVHFQEVRFTYEAEKAEDVLVFEPDGTCSSGRIILTDGNERYLVRVREGFGRIDVQSVTYAMERDAEQTYADLLAQPL